MSIVIIIFFFFSEPLAIVSETGNIDLSNHTVNDNITVICQVETCVPEVTMTLYKDNETLQTQFFADNTMDSISAAFTLNVQLDTAGKYACRAVAPEGFTPLSFFNITGTIQ